MDWLPVPALGGVNLFDDPRAIRDEEVQLARNLVPGRPGILKKRGGLSRPFTSIGPTDINLPAAVVMSPLAGGIYDAVTFMRSSGAQSSVVGVPFGATPFPFSATVPFDNPRPHLLPWNSKVYVLPGPSAVWTGPSGYPFYVYDVTAETGAVLSTLAFAGVGNANTYPAYAFPYKQRLVLAHFGKGYENTIAFTDDYTADVVGDDLLASNGRAISLVAGADGDEIVAGIEVMLTNVGSPAEAGLLILRRYGDPFLLTGDMDQTTGGQRTLDIKRVSVRTGCAGQYTVARTPVGIIWAGADDVWCFAAGVLPHRLGQKIQPALKLTPAQLQYRWSAAYFDGFYRLAIWGASQGMTATDAPGDQWWLDLREGLPPNWREAHWWGPQQFLGGATPGVAPVPQTWGMLVESRAGRDAKLYYVDREEVSASTPNGVIGEYGTDTRDMTAFAAYIADADYVDPEVTAELVTKEYALSPGRDQINDGVMFVVRPFNDLTISADFIIDDGDQVLTRTKRLGDTSSFQLDAAPLDATAPAFGPLTGKALKTALYPPTRRAGQTHCFRIYDTAGYTIAQGVNDSVAVALDSTGTGVYTYWIGTVAPGTYSISDLATAVAAAINAAKPAASHNWGFTSAAGIYTLNAGGPYGVGVSMSVRFNSTTLTPPDNGTAPTTAQALACRRLFGMLGFDNTGNTLNAGPGLSPSVAGDTAPFKKGAADWEIYGIAANMEVLPRTP